MYGINCRIENLTFYLLIKHNILYFLIPRSKKPHTNLNGLSTGYERVMYGLSTGYEAKLIEIELRFKKM